MSLPAPTLSTARLKLRPVDDADADALYAMHSNALVLRYWDSPPWTERARAERFIAGCRQLTEEGTGTRLAVERSTDGAFIGWCSLTRWNPDYRSASMGYCYDLAAWGHGYGTEAARVLLQWAFDTLDLNRVQAEADTRNAASARVLEKLGSSVKASYGRTASSTARSRTPGCTACSDGTGEGPPDRRRLLGSVRTPTIERTSIYPGRRAYRLYEEDLIHGMGSTRALG